MNIAQLGRLWSTSVNLTNGEPFSSKKVIAKKKVRFQPAVRVVLIPSRTEYSAADLNVELWWDDSDYSAFKASAVTELKAIMRLRNICNSKEAIRILYQPVAEGEADLTIEGCPHSNANKTTTQITLPTSTEDCSENLHKSQTTCPEEGELKLSLLCARTDLDLTNHTNFDKIHTRGDANATVEFKKVHPLAYMCS